MKPFLLLLFFVFSSFPANAGELNGKVVAVHDGDTITLLVDKTQTKIRLAGIDAPELKQPFGNNAKRALSESVFGKTVKVTDKGKDRYGRTIGDIYERENWVNLNLVEKGMAWVYLRYSHDPALIAAEAKARSGQTGLWHDANPVAPWEWRHEASSR